MMNTCPTACVCRIGRVRGHVCSALAMTRTIRGRTFGKRPLGSSLWQCWRIGKPIQRHNPPWEAGPLIGLNIFHICLDELHIGVLGMLKHSLGSSIWVCVHFANIPGRFKTRVLSVWNCLISAYDELIIGHWPQTARTLAVLIYDDRVKLPHLLQHVDLQAKFPGKGIRGNSSEKALGTRRTQQGVWWLWCNYITG